MTKRKDITTSNDFLKEIRELRKKLESTEVHLSDKLDHMAKFHPNAIIETAGSVEIKATCLTKEFITTLTVEKQVKYLDEIEKYSMKIQKGRQYRIDD